MIDSGQRVFCSLLARQRTWTRSALSFLDKDFYGEWGYISNFSDLVEAFPYRQRLLDQ